MARIRLPITRILDVTIRRSFEDLERILNEHDDILGGMTVQSLNQSSPPVFDSEGPSGEHTHEELLATLPNYDTRNRVQPTSGSAARIAVRADGNMSINTDPPTGHFTTNQGMWYGSTFGSFKRGNFLEQVANCQFDSNLMTPAFNITTTGRPGWYTAMGGTDDDDQGYSALHYLHTDDVDNWVSVTQRGADNRGRLWLGATNRGNPGDDDPPVTSLLLTTPFNRQRLVILGNDGEAATPVDGLRIAVKGDSRDSTPSLPLFVQLDPPGGSGTAPNIIAIFENNARNTQLNMTVENNGGPFILRSLD